MNARRYHQPFTPQHVAGLSQCPRLKETLAAHISKHIHSAFQQGGRPTRQRHRSKNKPIQSIPGQRHRSKNKPNGYTGKERRNEQKYPGFKIGAKCAFYMSPNTEIIDSGGGQNMEAGPDTRIWSKRRAPSGQLMEQ